MNKFLKFVFISLGAFGLATAGLIPTLAFAAEKVTKEGKTTKVDINHASEEELEAIPGIGKAYAKKIIDGRPYKNKKDLIKAGIPEKTVDKIKGSIKFGKEPKKTHKKKERKSAAKNTKAKPVEEDSRAQRREDTKVHRREVPQPHQRGKVWVNTGSNVYHKEGDRWYGNTEKGEYMTEEEAIKSGARLSREGSSED